MSRKAPRIIATIDCETDPFLHGRIPKPFIWDYFDGVKHATFEKTEDLITFLCGLPPTIIYAHNGGKFDYHMPGFLDELEPFSTVMLISGRLAKFKIGNCEFRDSVNILPIALADYKKEDIDYSKMEAEVRHLHMEEIKAYLYKDTEYLREIVCKFRETYGDGLTLAGSAMKFWQARMGIDAPRSTRGFYHNIGKWYYGGRVECFSKGIISQGFSMVDINSAYPYAMLHNHPISTECEMVSCSELDPIIEQSMYRVSATSKGCFPLRGNKGTLSFPNDDVIRTYFVTGWELKAGLETGTVKIYKYHFRYDFAEMVDFNKYINYFYDIKKTAKKGSPDYIFSKLFMNSLYGKFGANPEEYANYELIPPQFVEAAEADGKQFAGELGKWAVAKSPLDEEQQRFYNVATAASITGYVRAYLWRHICLIRANGGTVHYCDTDSLAFSGSTDGMRFDKELGGWSNDGDFIGGGIGGKKLYCFDKGPDYPKADRYKFGCKGVRLTPEQVLEVCAGQSVTYKRDAPSFGVRKSKDPNGGIRKTAGFVTRIVRVTHGNAP